MFLDETTDSHSLRHHVEPSKWVHSKMTTNRTNLYDSAKETTHVNGSQPTRELWQSVKEMICYTHSRD